MLCFVLLLSYHGCVSAYIGKFTLVHEGYVSCGMTSRSYKLSTLHFMYCTWHFAESISKLECQNAVQDHSALPSEIYLTQCSFVI